MSNQGLQGGWALNDGGQVDFPHALKNQFALMKSAGAAWVRLEFRLGRYYTDWTTPGADGTTALQKYDVVVSAAQAQGLQILGLLSSQSWHGKQAEWCANNAENNVDANGDNPYVTNFAQNAAIVLMQHFADSINTWEIWNEPNTYKSSPGPGVFVDGSFMYPSNFAWLLLHTYDAVQTMQLPNITIVSGGLFGQNITDDSPGDQYLTDTYTQGINNAGWDDFSALYGTYPLDMIGQHIYIDQGKITTDTHLQVFLDAIRNAYTTFEGEYSPKQTVITEVGWTTTYVSPEVQATNLQIAFQTFQQTVYVNQSFWFNVQDIDESSLCYGLQTGGNSGDHFSGSPKASFAAHQTYTAF